VQLRHLTGFAFEDRFTRRALLIFQDLIAFDLFAVDQSEQAPTGSMQLIQSVVNFTTCHIEHKMQGLFLTNYRSSEPENARFVSH
jgi:hypothetical protein